MLLGLERLGPPTSWTIGLAAPDEMGAKAAKAHATGRFRRLKLKLGGGDGLDVDRVRAVRESTDVPLQVDVNEWWSIDEALDALPQLDELGVEYCEQPLPAGDPGGAALKKASPDPDLRRRGLPHPGRRRRSAPRSRTGSTSSSAKSGGILEGVRMAHAARALGLGVMLGCMVETGLGIAAGAAMASLCDHVDLDGNLLIKHDPWPGVELVDGIQTPSEDPGLGVRRAP